MSKVKVTAYRKVSAVKTLYDRNWFKLRTVTIKTRKD